MHGGKKQLYRRNRYFCFRNALFLYKNTLSMRKSCVLRIDISVAANTKTSALRHNDP